MVTIKSNEKVANKIFFTDVLHLEGNASLTDVKVFGLREIKMSDEATISNCFFLVKDDFKGIDAHWHVKDSVFTFSS